MDEEVERLLVECGFVGLPQEARADLGQEVLSQLELRVGRMILDRLTAEEVREYEALIDEESDAASAWLDERVPDVREIVAGERARLFDVVRRGAPRIREAFGLPEPTGLSSFDDVPGPSDSSDGSRENIDE